MPWVCRFLCVVLVGVIPCCQDGCGPLYGEARGLGRAFLKYEVPRRRTLGQTGPLIEEDLVLSGKMSAGHNALVRACPSCPTAQKVPDFIGFLLVRFCPRACPGFCCFLRFLPSKPQISVQVRLSGFVHLHGICLF
jgi:hypothetical protein